MRLSLVSLALLLLLAVPVPARADELARDRIARAKLAAGFDPARLRDVAKLARDEGCPEEADHLIALARGIELDRRMAELEGVRSADAWLELARSLRAEGYPDSERKVVLARALELDPDHASVRFEMGQVRRQGRWVTFAEARELDAQALAQKGRVLRDGRWVDEVTAQRIDAAKAECVKQPGLDDDQREQLACEREAERRLELERATAAARLAETQAELELAKARLDAQTREMDARVREAEARARSRWAAANTPDVILVGRARGPWHGSRPVVAPCEPRVVTPAPCAPAPYAPARPGRVVVSTPCPPTRPVVPTPCPPAHAHPQRQQTVVVYPGGDTPGTVRVAPTQNTRVVFGRRR